MSVGTQRQKVPNQMAETVWIMVTMVPRFWVFTGKAIGWYASTLAQMSVYLLTISKLLGHADTRITSGTTPTFVTTP